MDQPTTTQITTETQLESIRSSQLRKAAAEALQQELTVELLTVPVLHPKTHLPTKALIETLVVDAESALQSVDGKPAISGEWHAREQLIVVYDDGTTLRLQLNGEAETST